MLFDLLGAPAGSPLHALARAFTRIEDLGHVLVWGSAKRAAGPEASAFRRIFMIELPRLRLRFQPREDPSGRRALYAERRVLTAACRHVRIDPSC